MRHLGSRKGVRIGVGLILLASTAGLGGCATVRSPVTVLGPWVGPEARNFQRVLDESGVRYQYQGSRVPGQVLQSNLENGTPPDIVVLPTIGELASHISDDTVRPLDDVIDGQSAAYGAPWLPRLSTGNQEKGHFYWVPIKASLKSLVWHNRNTNPKPPTTWDAMKGKRWCMGIGDAPNPGWPGSDWIEDILLHQSGTSTYKAWAAGRLSWGSTEVRQAWTTWGELQKRTPGGEPATLLTDFSDAGRGMFASPPTCDLEHQASFVTSVYQGYKRTSPNPLIAGADYDYVDFPTFYRSVPQAREVSVDVAALLSNTVPAKELIRFLATKKAQMIWPAVPGSGAFSVYKEANGPPPGGAYGDEVTKKIAYTLTSTGTGAAICLDASDLMPARMRDEFYRGILKYLSDPSRLDEILGRLDGLRKEVRKPAPVQIPACNR